MKFLTIYEGTNDVWKVMPGFIIIIMLDHVKNVLDNWSISFFAWPCQGTHGFPLFRLLGKMGFVSDWPVIWHDTDLEWEMKYFRNISKIFSMAMVWCKHLNLWFNILLIQIVGSFYFLLLVLAFGCFIRCEENHK